MPPASIRRPTGSRTAAPWRPARGRTAIGFQDGRFYANGWHITGEMGGIWSPPLKLADGIWFGIDDEWVKPATRFTSARGHVRYAFPPTAGLRLARTDFVPDNRRAALYGLTLANPAQTAKTVTVKVDVHSELMGAYPWTGSVGPPHRGRQPDRHPRLPGRPARLHRPRHAARRPGPRLRRARRLHPRAGGGRDRRRLPRSADRHGLRRDRHDLAAQRLRRRPARQGRRRPAALPRHDRRARRRDGLDRDRGLQPRARRRPQRAQHGAAGPRRPARPPSCEARDELAARSVVDLPGDRRLQEAVEWGKQNLADLTQTATDLKVRFVDQGKAYPEDPEGTIKRATFFGAGYPDYPWLFATDGEYTAFPAVALGQFETAEAHLRAVRCVSDLLNDRSGKVAHEIVTDGSVYFGADKDPGNTDESVKFPSAVALVWRWTGDNTLPRQHVRLLQAHACATSPTSSTPTTTAGPKGLGNVERDGMGEEKLDNAVYYVRGLYDLADMARSKRDRTTERWATGIADRARRALRRRPGGTRPDPVRRLAARRRPRPAAALDRRHADGGRADDRRPRLPRPGARRARHRRAARSARATASAAPTRSTSASSTPAARAAPTARASARCSRSRRRSRPSARATTAASRQRYTAANADPMFEPDEMPGALPEILPSPDQNANIGRCWTCRSMFMQAWGHYGTAWPVIHQQLGVRPSLGTGRLEIVPSIPEGQTRIGGRDIRLGDDGSVDVRAQRSGSRYTTTVTVDDVERLDGPARRRDAPGRRGGRDRHARRRPRPAPDGARDQPRRRGHGAGRRGRAQRGGGDHGARRVQTPHRRRGNGRKTCGGRGRRR